MDMTLSRSPSELTTRLSLGSEEILKVCAWCVAEGRQVRPPGVVSDGICPRHEREFLAAFHLAPCPPAAQPRKGDSH